MFAQFRSLLEHVILVDCLRLGQYNNCLDTLHRKTDMATTDVMRDAQRPLAEYAYDLRKKYGLTMGQSRKNFLAMYDLSEVQLSSVYENLFVAVRNKIGRPLTKISEDARDFSNDGDMKTTVLQKDYDKRRYVVSNVDGKKGTIYVVAWNWMTEEVNFFAIPYFGGFPTKGIKIPVCPKTGRRTKGWYNEQAYNSFEEMAMID
jgi:hypothetical protein